MFTGNNINRCVCAVLLLVIICPVVNVQGQARRPLIEYTSENGLSLNSVNDLHFDKQGFLWITTADGLQRFDGYHFQTFRYDPLNKSSLPENSVSTIFEDQSGNLWISHRTGICFKPKGKYEFVDLNNTMARFTFRYPLTCVNETDSTVWILNYPSGVFAVNKISLQIKKLYDLPGFSDQVLIYPVSRMYTKGENVWFKKRLDKGGDLYMFSDNGVKQFRNNRRTKIFFLIPAQKDSLVIISDIGMYKASANDPFTPVRIVRTGFDSTFFDTELLVLPRKIGNDQWLFLGAKKILVYDSKKEEVTLFPSGEYLPGELSRYLHTATADRHQNSWLGFNGIGGIKVITLQKFNLFNRPVKNALTYTLATDQMGKVFAGIYLGDIEVYDKEGRFIQTIKLPESHKKKSGSPRAMAMIDSVTLIVRSTLNELYAIDTRSGKVQLLSHLLPPRPDSVLLDFESAMQNIGKEEIWFSYANSVLSLKKSKSGFSCTTLCTLPVKEHITSIHLNNTGQLWIGTISGAWLFEKNNFQKTPLPHTYVKHISQQNCGKIWIATTNGIYILQENRVFKHLNTKDGLPNSFVYSVLFDNEGYSWVSTNRGLAKIDTAFRITSYSAKEGLQGDEFNTKGYCKTYDGTLYFAGVNGINFFKPRDLVSKSGASPTRLTEIAVNNKPYLPNLQPEFINTISLPYRENNMRLSFSCMDFTVPEKNQYKFWLKGFQDDWTLPQTNNTVQYILPVGEYELHVLGANYEGVWSKEPLILKINILPPWYQTTWAKTIFAILILTFVAAIFYFISRNRYQKKLRQLQMEQEIQKEKQRLSRDLHDNLGSQLTWLSNNIAQLEIAQQEQKPIEQKLETLKEGSGELMQTLRETIWIMNKEKIGAVEFFDKLVTHAARHIEAYPPLQLQTEENILSNLQLSSGQALQLFRICQEAVTNACKHAQATLLNIKASTDEKHFSITISDNGRGFDMNNDNAGHYGLQNMQERATESNLELSIQSSPGKGTSISISV
jgi:signal transduction histidine kinase/ligand-binding sensor domain-containing protein